MTMDRFAFGKNWKRFVERHFSQERVDISRRHILAFLGLPDLENKTFLDIGCGSGLHSLAAFQAGATRVVSFDYDAECVETTRRLRLRVGDPERWTVRRGSVLDRTFMESLEVADIVYSWGVLHHTGDQWTAMRNAASKLSPNGVFYVALYTSDVFVDPPPEFWLDVKRRYVGESWLGQRRMELWYIRRFMNAGNAGPLRTLIKHGLTKRENRGRGMSLYTDMRDWLGGWPMEFSSVAEVKRFADQELNLELRNIVTGQANTEYLFARRP